LRVVQQSVKGTWDTVVVRLCGDDVRDDGRKTTRDLVASVTQNQQILNLIPLSTPINEIRLLLPPTLASSEPYLTRVMVDLISLQRRSVVEALLGGSARPSAMDRVDSQKVECSVGGVTYTQAVAIGQAVRRFPLSIG
jgi:hypothetical protein